MITSATNGRIKYIQTLMEKSKFRRKEKKFVAEGIKMFMEATADMISEVYVMESAKDSFEKEVRQKLDLIPYEVVTDSVYKKMTDTVTPQGIMTVLKMKENTVEDIISKENPLLVMLENIQDPGNLGTILRTAEGAGVAGIIMSRDCVDIYNPKVIRSTMGSIYRMKFVYVDDLTETMKQVKDKGINIYACALDANSKEYDEYDYTKSTAILIGNEGNGLKGETVKAAGNVCYIPMSGRVESLNASVACAVMMYEAKRQRK